MSSTLKREKRDRRHRRVRAKIRGTAQVPRLCVFRSNRHIYAQLIDDEKKRTLVASSDLALTQPAGDSPPAVTANEQEKTKEEKEMIRKGKIAASYEVGKLIAQKAVKAKIKKVVFDRGGYKYHGRVKALAEGGRKAGLEF